MNQLPYTVDFKRDAVVPYTPQMHSDPLKSFYDIVTGYKWKSEIFEEMFTDAKGRYENSVRLSLLNQAVSAAKTMVRAFLHDLASGVLNSGYVNRDFYEHLDFDASSIQGTTHLTTRRVIYGSHISLNGLTLKLDNGYGDEVKWQLIPLDQHQEVLPLYVLDFMNAFREKEVYPRLGSFWVAVPVIAEKDKWIIYFSIGKMYVALAFWITGTV